MAASIRTDDARRLVVAQLTGTFGLEDVVALVKDARELAHARGYALLYDLSQATPGDISMGDVYFLPRRLPVLSGPAALKSRAALVYPKAFEYFARFWETAFNNMGLRAKAFEERAAALAWLDSAGDEP